MINWDKYGFEEDSEWTGIYSHPEIPLMFAVEDEHLTIYTGEGLEYKLSNSIIPATNRNIEMFVKAFCVGV